MQHLSRLAVFLRHVHQPSLVREQHAYCEDPLTLGVELRPVLGDEVLGADETWSRHHDPLEISHRFSMENQQKQYDSYYK